MTFREVSRVFFVAMVLAASCAALATGGRGSTITASPASETSQASPTTKPFREIPDQQRLHNAHVVTGKVISGAQPEGEDSFKLLKELGVKTIISVDGAAPDVDLARAYGMRYVHLPIGYDGVDVAEGKAIAKAIDELPGPIYLHCHHGKHRSAAAVAVACVYNGMLKPEQAESVLQTFGTGANYKGLWKAAREARPLDAAELRSLNVEYVERAKIPDMAAHMVKVDQHWDHLKQVKAAGWKSPANHPDLDPAHEALQLEEHLRESTRLEAAAAHPAGFMTMLKQSEADTRSLGAALSARPINVPAAEKAFNAVAQSCTACHKAYRD